MIPVSGYYEWRKSDRKPFRFSLEDRDYAALAGLWDAWKSPGGYWLESMSIVTVPANSVMSGYHDRMPAILDPQNFDEWLDRIEVERPPVHLLQPYAGKLLVHEAHAKVGNVRETGIEMLNSA